MRWEDGGVGIALIGAGLGDGPRTIRPAVPSDGNGTRTFETLMRYRGAAIAEFLRALKALKALQAEPAAAMELPAGADLVPELPVAQLAAPAPCARVAPCRSAPYAPDPADQTNPAPS